MTLVIPVYNQLTDSKGCMGTFKYMTSEDTEFMIIDNGSTDPYEDWVRKSLKPKKLNYIRNEGNLGMLKTLQQAYENCETDLIAISHNDVLVYEKDWDKRVSSYFEEMPDLGGVGFFGTQGCGPIGERIQDVAPGVCAGLSNMMEAEIHGARLDRPWRSAAIFDGFMQIFRMEVLKKSNGFDQRYHYHHLYDRDAALEVIKHGYKNIVVDVPCHHLSGLTANRSEYQTWIDMKTKNAGFTGDKWTHDENTRLFTKKWKDVLPLYIEDDFSFRSGTEGPYEFKGGAICKK